MAINAEGIPTYSRCGLPYVLSGHIKRPNDLLIFPLEYYNRARIDLILSTKVVSVEPKSKEIMYARQGEGKAGCEKMQYDKLILATGSLQYVPDVEGIDKKGVCKLNTMEDLLVMMEKVKTAKKVVVLGAGLISLEFVEAFIEIGLEAFVQVRSRILRSVVDSDMGEIVEKGLMERGAHLIKGDVEKIEGEKEVESVSIGGEKIKTDLVLNATGYRPNTTLAEDCGIRLGDCHGIKTNPMMETNIADIYAAGDCIEAKNLVTQAFEYWPLGTRATRQGKAAGINAAGGKASILGFSGSIVSKIFGTEIGATGITESKAKDFGYNVITARANGLTKAEYYPGALPITTKLTFDRGNGKLIGAQIVGGEGVAQRINTFAVCIQAALTAADLNIVDTCYNPPLGETWESSIHSTSDIALTKLRRIV